ncbi:MAG: hypothetical protein ACI84O_000881 [Myxococcota bacterium]|jgi:hypothetical protein
MKHILPFLSACCLLIAATSSLSAQSQDDWVEWGFVDGLNSGDSFGSSMLAIGDINGDLYEDYVVASPQSGSYLRLAGEISIHSGQDNSIIASISGSDIGQQIGYSICLLGEHQNDGLLKIAASAPFANTTSGYFSGVVNIYAFDLVNMSLSLWQEIPGDRAGMMFGVSVAALDNDGNGDLDLAISSIGDGDPNNGASLDGSVTIYEIDSSVADNSGTITSYGVDGSAEMFGWDICFADSNGEQSLLVGAPFANANNSGAAVRIKTDGTQLLLQDPLATADAHLGFAVAAGSDISGDGIADFVASAPNTAKGSVVIWDDTLQAGVTLEGTYNNEKFGYSIAITADANFNASDDLIVGAPEAGNNFGRFAVHDVSIPAQTLLYAANGSTSQLLGSSVSTAGDINQSTKSEILVSAIGNNNSTGRVYIYSPPEQDIGPIELDANGAFEWETDLTLTATNLSTGGGGLLYWYRGTQQGTSTSNEGFELNIAGNVQLLGTTSNPGSEMQYVYNIPDAFNDGQLLLFQVVEDRSGFIRSSDIDGGFVIDPGVTIFVDGDQAGSPITVRTKWGIPNSPVYIYASAATPSGNAINTAPDGAWLLNLRNPKAIGSPGDQSNSLGHFTSLPINVPSTMVGATGYFQAYDWDFFEPGLTRVTVVTFQ